MIKILLVDDEYHVISHILNLLQQIDFIEINALCATSGSEALKIVASSHIDVAFLDINMPQVSGLQIAAKLHRQWPDCQIIFLTAYEVFDYIYEANQYPGAIYLLKAEPDAKILDTAASCCQAILKKREEKKNLSQVQRKEKLLLLLQEQQLLREVVYGIPAGDLERFVKNASLEIHFSLEKDVYLMLMHIRRSASSVLDSAFYLEKMEHLLGNLFLFSFLETETGTLLWIFQEKDLPDMELSYFDCLKDTMDSFLDICSEAKHQTLSLCLYREKVAIDQLSRYWQFLYDSYYEESSLLPSYSSAARVVEKERRGFAAVPGSVSGSVAASDCGNASGSRVAVDGSSSRADSTAVSDNISGSASAAGRLSGSQTAIASGGSSGSANSYGSGSPSNSQISPALSKRLSAMKLALYQGNRDLFLTELSHCRQYCSAVKSMHHIGAIRIYFSVVLIYLEYIGHYNLMPRIAMETALYPLYYIHDFPDWDHAFTYLRRMGEVLFGIASETDHDKTQQLVASIQNYIQLHLSDNLNLTVIANYVNYNESHISRMFKRFTGSNLSEYITSCRIAYAKSLLAETNDTVQVISRKAGFHTSQYFSSTFKKSTGLSPNEYRMQKGMR